jgi:hypothetical protein
MEQNSAPRTSAVQRMAADLAFIVALGVFMGAFYRSMDGLPPTARRFPLFVLAVLTALIVVNVIQAVRHGVIERRVEGPDVGGLPAVLAAARSGAKPIITLIALVVFVEVIPVLGFFTAVLALLIVLGWLFGVRRPIPLFLATVGTTAACYWLFVVLLRLRFPSGLFI